jgi:MFS family permease
MLGVGGVISVPFAQRFGRIPVLWWSMFMSLFMTLFATLSPNNTTFIVARCLQGFFTTAPQCIGLSLIHDMYICLSSERLTVGSSSMNMLERSVSGHGRLSSRPFWVHFSPPLFPTTKIGASRSGLTLSSLEWHYSS